jgi:uncharacterized protein YidB (DUF937 family)
MKDLRTLWGGLPRAARIAIAGVAGCLVAGVAVGATAAATGFPVAATSSTPTPTASPKPATSSSACQDYLDHLASDLGLSQSKVTAAQTSALDQTLSDMVARGQLAQAQATKLEQQATKACSSAPALLARAQNQARIRRLVQVGLQDYAKALGISASTLRQDLRSGQTVAQLAQQQGLDESAFRQKLIAVVKPQLDQAVQAHLITQAQENRVLQRLQTGNLPLWDRIPRSAPASRPTPTASS